MLASLLLPAAAFAAPASLSARATTAQCAPTSYAVDNFGVNYVRGAPTQVFFDVTSTFPDRSIIVDSVQDRTWCATISGLQSHNSCNNEGTLSFDVEGNTSDYAYELFHQWTCNG